jgi:hypothetical protein
MQYIKLDSKKKRAREEGGSDAEVRVRSVPSVTFFFFWNSVLYTARVLKTQKRSPEGSYCLRLCGAGIAMLSVCVMAIEGGGRVWV